MPAEQLSEREQRRRQKQRETPRPAYCALAADDDSPSSDTIPSSQKSGGQTRARAPPPPLSGHVFLRLKAVLAKVGLPSSSIYALNRGQQISQTCGSERAQGGLAVK